MEGLDFSFGRRLSMRTSAQILLLLLSVTPWLRLSGAQGPKKVDLVTIVKSTRTMTLMSGGRVVKVYRVALSGNPVGAKTSSGDHRTPEGRYFVDSKNPNSRFHRALHLSYPNAVDRERARRLNVSPGGNIEIHGLPDRLAWVGPLHRVVGWTDGCIALTNPEIEEVYALVPVGTAVDIRPR
jgi:murein L,D-transpeptidase YafK